MEKLTFKQYVASKERLKEAALNAPKYTVEYTVKKYCKLVVGENKEERIHVPLKPLQKIVVEWLLEDVESPTPQKISFLNVKEIDNSSTYQTFWPSSKLTSWLYRNTKEEIPPL